MSRSGRKLSALDNPRELSAANGARTLSGNTRSFSRKRRFTDSRLAKIHKEMRVVPIERFQMRGDRPPQFSRRPPSSAAAIPAIVRNICAIGFLDDEVEQLLLAVEMMVEAAFEDAEPRRQCRERWRRDSLWSENTFAAAENDVVERGHYSIALPTGGL